MLPGFRLLAGSFNHRVPTLACSLIFRFRAVGATEVSFFTAKPVSVIIAVYFKDSLQFNLCLLRGGDEV